ncbi:hypothetical protein H6G27_24710 [Nostoc linckia FACHB-104]|nr:hypothetical protein [Nostoc linckia FACHB-104]
MREFEPLLLDERLFPKCELEQMRLGKIPDLIIRNAKSKDSLAKVDLVAGLVSRSVRATAAGWRYFNVKRCYLIILCTTMQLPQMRSPLLPIS